MSDQSTPTADDLEPEPAPDTEQTEQEKADGAAAADDSE